MTYVMIRGGEDSLSDEHGGGGVGKSIENSVGLRSDWCRVVSGVGHKEERGVAGHVSGSEIEAFGR